MADQTFPYLRFYASDYLGDRDRAGLSAKADMVHIIAIALSHSGTPYGYLNDSNKRPLTVDNAMDYKSAAILKGKVTRTEFLAGWKECMDQHRIEYDRRCKTYYVPKMVRIGQGIARSRAAGQLGGNPVLKRPLSVEQQWERALNEIILEARKIPGPMLKEWTEALWDKYKDVPKLGELHVVTEARRRIRRERAERGQG